MRHRVKGRKLNRAVKHRKSLFKNLISALIEHGEIKTTEAKAKAIKGLVDKLITKAKSGSVHARRLIGSFLNRRSIVNRLVDTVAPQLTKRTSGYTRIIKLGRRQGDRAMMVKMQLVDVKTSSSQKPEKDTNSKSQKQNPAKTNTTKKQAAIKKKNV